MLITGERAAMTLTFRKNNSKTSCSFFRCGHLIAAAARGMLPVVIVLLVGLPAFAADEAAQSGGERFAIGRDGNTASRVARPGYADRSARISLAPGDQIKVLVFDQQQLSGDFALDGAGKVLPKEKARRCKFCRNYLTSIKAQTWLMQLFVVMFLSIWQIPWNFLVSYAVISVAKTL